MRRFYLAGQQEVGGKVSDVTPSCGQIVILKLEKEEETQRRFYNSRVIHGLACFKGGLLDCEVSNSGKVKENNKDNKKMFSYWCGDIVEMAWLALWKNMWKVYFSLSSSLLIIWNFSLMSFAQSDDRNAGIDQTRASSLSQRATRMFGSGISSPCHF